MDEIVAISGGGRDCIGAGGASENSIPTLPVDGDSELSTSLMTSALHMPIIEK